MSGENVEIVRSIHRAWETGSPSESGLIADDIEWVNAKEAIEPGTRSGIDVDRRQGYVWTVRDGKAVRFQWFNDPAEALAAAGIEGGR